MILRVGVLILVLLLASLLPTHAQSPADQIPQLAAEINLWRLSEGLGPLVYNPTLEAMAAQQADYLLTLPGIPQGGAIHTGARGEDIRTRSQFTQFTWPTFGHPQRISVTEIAGVGTIKSALDFWHSSDLHRRSVTNPNYREIGIAARQLNNRNKDILFIVVLGSEPGILPALADIEVDLLYLTTEASTWQGDWIGAVKRYRVLDASRQPLTEWSDWRTVVDLPPAIPGTSFFVEYEDAAGKRTETEVPLQPLWSSISVTRAAVVPTVASASSGPVFATYTPIPPPSPTPTPSPTPAPGAMLLVYDKGTLTLLSQADNLNLSGIRFVNGEADFTATTWERLNPELNIGALRRDHCLQIRAQGSGASASPPACKYVRSIVFLGAADVFWQQGAFEVRKGDLVLSSCRAQADSCFVTVR